jgi:hypothetical protein
LIPLDRRVGEPAPHRFALDVAVVGTVSKFNF